MKTDKDEESDIEDDKIPIAATEQKFDMTIYPIKDDPTKPKYRP